MLPQVEIINLVGKRVFKYSYLLPKGKLVIVSFYTALKD